MAHYGMPRLNLRRQLSGLERTKWGVSGTSTQANCTSVVGGMGGEAVVGWDASGAADAVQGLALQKDTCASANTIMALLLIYACLRLRGCC